MSSSYEMPIHPNLPPQGTVVSGLLMKRRNPWLAWLLWPILTLGIYHFVWYYKIHSEMAEFDSRRKVPIVGPVLVLIFLGWTFIGPLISYHNAGERIRNAQRAAGLEPTCSPIAAMLLSLLFGANTAYCQIQLNKIVDKYDAPEGTQVQLFV